QPQARADHPRADHTDRRHRPSAVRPAHAGGNPAPAGRRLTDRNLANMNPISRYLDGIHRELGHRATWLPDEKLKLGDLGVFDRGRFVLRSSLAQLNIKFAQRHGHGGELLSASAGSQLDTSIDGRIADASASIKFGRAGSFVFLASNTRTDAIADMVRVSQE